MSNLLQCWRLLRAKSRSALAMTWFCLWICLQKIIRVVQRGFGRPTFASIFHADVPPQISSRRVASFYRADGSADHFQFCAGPVGALNFILQARACAEVQPIQHADGGARLKAGRVRWTLIRVRCGNGLGRN